MTKVFETPHFNSEQEEAEWWDSHQDELLVAFEEAEKNGTLGRGTLAREGIQAFETLANIQTNEPALKQKSAA